MLDQRLAELEQLFLALSDKTRMRLLAVMNGTEVSVGYLAETLDQSQPKISRHLAYLRNSGLVSTRREGKSIYYAINHRSPEAVFGLLSMTLDLLNGERARPAPRLAAAAAPSPEPAEPASEYQPYSHAYQPYSRNEPAQETYDDWHPEELEVFLL